MVKNDLHKFFEKYIENTPYHGIITIDKIIVGQLEQFAANLLQCQSTSVFASTRMVKHIYDKRTAEEFDFLLRHLEKILAKPDKIYINKDKKRGNYCLIKVIDEFTYMAVIEIVQTETGTSIEMATSFRVRGENALNNYDLLWSWRDGAHSS